MKISEMTYSSILADTDRIEISKNSSGTHITRSTSMADIKSYVRDGLTIGDCITELYEGVYTPPEGKPGDMYGHRLTTADEYAFYICTKE